MAITKLNLTKQIDIQASNQNMLLRNMEIKNSIERRPTRVRKTLVNALANGKEVKMNKILEAIEEEELPEESYLLEDDDDDDGREEKV